MNTHHHVPLPIITIMTPYLPQKQKWEGAGKEKKRLWMIESPLGNRES